MIHFARGLQEGILQDQFMESTLEPQAGPTVFFNPNFKINEYGAPQNSTSPTLGLRISEYLESQHGRIIMIDGQENDIVR